MLSQPNTPKTYTPEQVADILQLSKNTIYTLISRGEIIAKRLGKVYRIPQSSISFVFSGLDSDLLQMEREDMKILPEIQKSISNARKLIASSS